MGKFKISEDGKLTMTTPLISYIGKDADEAICQIIEDRKCLKITDCIGYNGYREVTLMHSGERIEFVCETDKANEVVDEIIAPSEADWRVMDIFVYTEDPLPKKKYH